MITYPLSVELNSSKRIPLRGIFVGAKVKKGLNWNFGDEVGLQFIKTIDYE